MGKTDFRVNRDTNLKKKQLIFEEEIKTEKKHRKQFSECFEENDDEFYMIFSNTSDEKIDTEILEKYLKR